MGMSRKIATRFACAVIREGKVDIGLASFVRHSFDGMQTFRGIIGSGHAGVFREIVGVPDGII
jgi:hypothetical protein